VAETACLRKLNRKFRIESNHPDKVTIFSPNSAIAPNDFCFFDRTLRCSFKKNIFADLFITIDSTFEISSEGHRGKVRKFKRKIYHSQANLLLYMFPHLDAMKHEANA